MTLPRASASAGKRFGQALAGVLLIALLVLSRAGPAQAQGDADPYSTTVKVDATAGNSVDARRLARLDGERRALTKVVEQVSGSSDVQLPKLDDNAVTDMVESFEVAHERMSAVRYLADYTFHFYPDKVKRLLRKVNLTAAPASSPAVSAGPAATGGQGIVVLPVYDDGTKAMLWDDPNPWREAWSERSSGSGPVRLIVPLGDIGDLTTIDAQQAEAGRPGALAAIARRNGGAEVVVALAKPRRSDNRLAGIDVRLRRYRDGRLVGSSGESFDAAPGEDRAALLRRAAAAAAGAIAAAENLSAGTSSGSSPEPGEKAEEGSIAAVVPITSLGDWIAVRQRLVAIPAIRSIALLSLNREEARIRMRYTGSPEQLKADLAAADLALDGGDPLWRLRPAGAADQP
jgi:hypothetical protein